MDCILYAMGSPIPLSLTHIHTQIKLTHSLTLVPIPFKVRKPESYPIASKQKEHLKLNTMPSFVHPAPPTLPQPASQLPPPPSTPPPPPQPTPTDLSSRPSSRSWSFLLLLERRISRDSGRNVFFVFFFFHFCSKSDISGASRNLSSISLRSI